MMTVHDALQAWQAGQISSRRAMALTDTNGLAELYALAEACDVEIKIELSENERRAVAAASAAIERALAREDAERIEGRQFA